jgi:YggT family protein
VIANVLCRTVQIYLFIMFIRVIFSWVTAFKPEWRPPDALRPVLVFISGVTDPPVELLRRFIPPLGSGGMALDLAFLVWFIIVAYPIRSIVCSLVF